MKSCCNSCKDQIEGGIICRDTRCKCHAKKPKKPNLRKDLLPHQKRYLPALLWLFGGILKKNVVNAALAKADPEYYQRLKTLPGDILKKARGSGRTYLMATTFILIALEYPMQKIPVRDHSADTYNLDFLVSTIQSICIKHAIGFMYDHKDRAIQCWLP